MSRVLFRQRAIYSWYSWSWGCRCTWLLVNELGVVKGLSLVLGHGVVNDLGIVKEQGKDKDLDIFKGRGKVKGLGKKAKLKALAKGSILLSCILKAPENIYMRAPSQQDNNSREVEKMLLR